jgi:hypothetical protein
MLENGRSPPAETGREYALTVAADATGSTRPLLAGHGTEMAA